MILTPQGDGRMWFVDLVLLGLAHSPVVFAGAYDSSISIIPFEVDGTAEWDFNGLLATSGDGSWNIQVNAQGGLSDLAIMGCSATVTSGEHNGEVLTTGEMELWDLSVMDMSVTGALTPGSNNQVVTRIFSSEPDEERGFDTESGLIQRESGVYDWPFICWTISPNAVITDGQFSGSMGFMVNEDANPGDEVVLTCYYDSGWQRQVNYSHNVTVE